MTNKQIKRFVKRINYGRPIYIEFKYKSYNESYAALAVRGDPCYIWVNDSYIGMESNLYIKTMLLHEVGHLNTPNYISCTTRELNAQLWGIQRAIELNMFRVAREMINMIEQWRIKGSITGLYRYRKAGKIFKEEYEQPITELLNGKVKESIR